MIDGTLCQLTREGMRATGHQPLATAIVEFQRGPMCYFVREHPYGLLPGIPNLYCLDGAFRLQWMADWPEASGPCAAILGHDGDVLSALSVSGAVIKLDSHTGRLVGIESAIAAAS